MATAPALLKTETSKKQIILAITIVAITASVFWIDSRYPALYKKFHSGPAVQVRGALTFDNVLKVDRQMPLARRVAYTSVNWLAANRVGMTFGFLFGAGLLTLLPRLRNFGSGNAYKSIFFGTLTGVPLGVCSNCVAPIGQGLAAAGVKRESVLATMISSPTLNVIVLATAFSLFPLRLVLLKVALTAAVLFLFLPRLAALPASAGKVASSSAARDSWPAASADTVRSFLKNFWYLLRTAGPLMLLAAALGALAIELLPPQPLHLAVTLWGIVLVAVVGSFLPVPMAFDVFAAYVAMRSGVPLPYVAILLCTLGAYSVYSFLITGRAFSWKVAGAVFAAVCASGIVAGLVALVV